MPGTPWEQFKCGVFFGMGLIIAYGVLLLILLLVNIVLAGASTHAPLKIGNADVSPAPQYVSAAPGVIKL